MSASCSSSHRSKRNVAEVELPDATSETFEEDDDGAEDVDEADDGSDAGEVNNSTGMPSTSSKRGPWQ